MGYELLLSPPPAPDHADAADYAAQDKDLWENMVHSNTGKVWETVMLKLRLQESGTAAFDELGSRYQPVELTDSTSVILNLLGSRHTPRYLRR